MVLGAVSESWGYQVLGVIVLYFEDPFKLMGHA